MILNLEKLQEEYGFDIRGVIHIGAHHGEECVVYKKMGITSLLLFEPVPESFGVLKNNVRRIFDDDSIRVGVVNMALGNYNGKATMHIASNDGISSSLLDPLYHRIQYPPIRFNDTLEVDIVKLDDYLGSCTEFNFISIDVQGYELEVFKGATETLESIDCIIAEVNMVELYKGCVEVAELDSFLGGYGFERVETNWTEITWGDALYIKK